MANTATLVTTLAASVVTPGHEPFPTRISLLWTEANPLDINLDFVQPDESTVTWLLSRDLFTECLLGEIGVVYGEGDAVLERAEVSMSLTLNGTLDDLHNHTAVITFFTGPVLELITASLMRVPRGDEEEAHIQAELETFLEGLLSP